MDKSNTYKVLMEDRWKLEDLYTLPHAYGQAYSFEYCLNSDLRVNSIERIESMLREYPWRGGYSYVNFYHVLRNQVPFDKRPTIAEIRYASPGYIALALDIDVAFQVAKAIGLYSSAGVGIAAAYDQVHAALTRVKQRRRAERLHRLEFTKQEIDAIDALLKALASSIGFINPESLITKAGSVEIAARLIMAHVRRLKILSEFAVEGKAAFPQARQTPPR